MTILITGATGFVGGHLIETLLSEKIAEAGKNDELFGINRNGLMPDSLAHLSGKITLLPCDLLDQNQIKQVAQSVQPDTIFHLAGYSHNGKSFSESQKCWQENLATTQNLFEAVLKYCRKKPRILVVSTGLVYGDATANQPAFHEDCSFNPSSPYAASKAACDLMAFQYYRTSQLDVIRTRPFNHIGARQSADFAVANFARQIAEAKAGKNSGIVHTGDLSASRDFTDVRDICRAYLSLIKFGKSGEAYNIGTGQSHVVREILERLVYLSGAKIQVVEKRNDRASDTIVSNCDVTKIRQQIQWRPTCTLDDTLKNILDYWTTQA